jgi:preprotein translocase subunit SecG
MGVVSIVLLVLFVIASVLLMLVVLVQDEQGEGLGGLFSSGGTSFGPRTGNILTRFTSILGAAFLVGAFAVAWLNRTPEVGDVVDRARLERLQGQQQADWWVEQGQLSTPAEGGSTDSSAAASADQPAAGQPAANPQPATQ